MTNQYESYGEPDFPVFDPIDYSRDEHDWPPRVRERDPFREQARQWGRTLTVQQQRKDHSRLYGCRPALAGEFHENAIYDSPRAVVAWEHREGFFTQRVIWLQSAIVERLRRNGCDELTAAGIYALADKHPMLQHEENFLVHPDGDIELVGWRRMSRASA